MKAMFEMLYHDKYKNVVREFKKGIITKEEACDKIVKIEEWAYKIIQNAEVDGDITFAASVAIDEINRLGRGKKESE